MTARNAWINALVKGLAATDPALAEEIQACRHSRSLTARRARIRGTARLARAAVRPSLRNIVLRVGRPVLAVVGGAAHLAFTDEEGAVWRARLEAASGRLQRAARGVGRIEVSGVPGLTYAGTGWLVAPDTIVTNRHVARAFAERAGRAFTFKRGHGTAPIGARIDFLEEAGRPDELECRVVDILHIEPDNGPDFAVLRVETGSGLRAHATPIPLAASPARTGQQVAVIGYPARDGRVADEKLMLSIFGDVYDKKRLAPGQVTGVRPEVVLHDCSTLGGNSGSVLLDLDTGHAVGLHFAGRFLEANYAVPAAVVAARLDRVLRPRPGKPSPIKPPAMPSPHLPPSVSPPAADGTEVILEGVPADYVGRPGYDPAFVGRRVPLPVVKNRRDVLTFSWNGRKTRELKYQHFSVVMSRSRRLCVFSAVNIDGSRPGRFKRPAWRLDPRIPAGQQIREECYGNEPLFSRGHMTRREDPIWGPAEDAALGNSDSMHVTNTVPQMQPFNAGIWLGLEDYALQNARADQMRISVFTGPFFGDDDPVRVGVAIPRAFWKVIVFVHDETGELSATGYRMSQDSFLQDEEFVFGQHQTTQTRIRTIEQQAGLSFGPLAALDPFDDIEEGVGSLLTDPSQIRFLRR
jgi:endonuclease G